LLQALRQLPGHQFWSDELSIASDEVFTLAETTTSKAITDLYLLALAVKRKGTLSTFDTRIDSKCVSGGSAALEVLESV